MTESGFSRRALLLGASAAVLAGCARPPVRITRPTASPTGTVRDQLTQIMGTYTQNTDKLGLAVRDLRSGQDWTSNGNYSSQSASMAKVMISAMALRKARSEGHELDFDKMALVSRAIIDSDNNAADTLWDYAGGPDAYQRLANELLMTNTRRDPANTFWSWTWTTPSDQIVLLDRLLHGTPALTESDRLYLLDVMRKTNPAQTWGVGHDKGDHVEVQMKNGWVEFKSSDGLWAVNSMGHVSGDGRDYLAAMMCRVPTFETGRALLDAIGGDLFRVLGAGTL